MEKTVLYFDKPGKANTDATLTIARARAEELGIRQIVVASIHGFTAKRAHEIFKGLDITLIAVPINAGFEEEGWVMRPEEYDELHRLGIKVITSIHALGDNVDAAFSSAAPSLIVRETLRTFGQGMKVAVEISLMAADAGLLDMSHEVIAVAGSSSGADTAIVLRPTFTRRFQELHICEILAKPR